MKVLLDIHEDQIKKLLRGDAVQIPYAQLSGKVVYILDPKQRAAYRRAVRSQAGFRIKLDGEYAPENRKNLADMHDHIDGEGFKDIVKSVRKSLSKTLKPIGKSLKQSVKTHGKQFLLDAIRDPDTLDFVKQQSGRRLAGAARDATQIGKVGIRNTIVVGERALEDMLIKKGLDEEIARAIIDKGSHTISQKVFNELNDVESKLEHVVNGAGLRRNVHYEVVGGKLSFKKFLRKLKRGFGTILKYGKPVLKPLLQQGLAAGAMSLGIPAPIAQLAGSAVGGVAYDKTQKATGGRLAKGMTPAQRMAFVRSHKRSRGGALMPAGYY